MINFEVAPHLNWLEIISPDTGQGALHLSLLECWTELRAEIDRPITIYSGFRSLEYNRKVGGSSRSQHLIGRALDVACRGVDFESDEVKRLLLECGFTGIGTGQNITHVDTRDAPCYFWKYLPRGGHVKDEKMFRMLEAMEEDE